MPVDVLNGNLISVNITIADGSLTNIQKVSFQVKSLVKVYTIGGVKTSLDSVNATWGFINPSVIGESAFLKPQIADSIISITGSELSDFVYFEFGQNASADETKNIPSTAANLDSTTIITLNGITKQMQNTYRQDVRKFTKDISNVLSLINNTDSTGITFRPYPLRWKVVSIN